MSETYSAKATVLRRVMFASVERVVWEEKKPPYLFLKRMVDVLLSLTVLFTILWWLIPIVAILIKLNSNGPIFFIQTRIGRYGKKFRCIKLRTMVVNPVADMQQASNNDPRITNLGKFLRLSCIDELPQFINVLMGDMSVVGPRPHMINDCQHFSKVIPSYNYRHSMKPGITGIAQVKGYRGKTNSFFDISHRYQWDRFYIINANTLLDLSLIYKTLSKTINSVYRFTLNETKKEVSRRLLPSRTETNPSIDSFNN